MSSIKELLKTRASGLPATIKMGTTYHVFEDTDKTEGRGGQKLRFVVHDPNEAKALSKGLGPMGCDGRVEKVEGLIISTVNEAVFAVPFHYVVETAADRKAALRAQAIAKLSKEERDALGLK